ncbi:hypothetical protein MASR2M29_08140 [Spirochaetota bacterium]
MKEKAFGISALVLAGGTGCRLQGKDKLFLDYKGERLLGRIERQLKPHFSDILAACNRTEAMEGLGYRLVKDVFPGMGPLSGLLAGLRAAKNQWLYLLACDMPYFSSVWLEELRRRAAIIEEEGMDIKAIAAMDGLHHEPFHALYHVSLASIIEELLPRQELYNDSLKGALKGAIKGAGLQSLAKYASFEFLDMDKNCSLYEAKQKLFFGINYVSDM